MTALSSAQLIPLTSSFNRLETELNQFALKVDGDIEEMKKTTNLLKQDLMEVQCRVDKVELQHGSESLMQRVKEIKMAKLFHPWIRTRTSV